MVPSEPPPRFSIQTNGVVERFFGTLKYENLFRAEIGDGGDLAMEIRRFRQIYITIRPHRGIGDRTPHQAFLTRGGTEA